MRNFCPYLQDYLPQNLAMSLPVISRSSADLVCRRLQRAFIAYCCLTFWGALPPGSMAAGEAESIALFNGRNLEGWVQRGGKAQYLSLIHI